MAGYLRIEMKEHGAAWITLARPEKHNAFDEKLIAELTAALKQYERDDAVASVVLAADGKSFSAGADLDWMRRAAAQGKDENVEDARKLGQLMLVLDTLAKPTVAVVEGPAYGGGVGLVACCDIAIAMINAKFSLSETRLGLIPAVIAPYLVAAIGARHARRYFQTAEVFGAEVAKEIGLVHEIAADPKVRAQEIAKLLASTAPQAKAASKRLIRTVAHRDIGEAVTELTAQTIAGTRAGEEAKEGIAAFFEKRKPRWRK